jgi:hypothetical protein
MWGKVAFIFLTILCLCSCENMPDRFKQYLGGKQKIIIDPQQEEAAKTEKIEEAIKRAEARLQELAKKMDIPGYISEVEAEILEEVTALQGTLAHARSQLNDKESNKE